jgi:hypothetical protein
MDNLKIVTIALIAAFMFTVMPLALISNQEQLVQVTHEITIGTANPEATAKAKPAPTSTDYKLSINRGKTDIPIALTVYTENEEGINSVDFVSAISDAADEWDSHTSAGLVSEITEVSSRSTSVSLNGENAVFFGDYSQENVIAVASYWYNRATREIVECDIMFDTDFQWGDAKVDSSLMDLQNIATHELGHFFNLADIYDNSKDYLTMFGYSGEGDIEKRSLAAGDIAGIRKVFGA